MPKCHAPYPVSYRGKPVAVAPDGMCELDDVQLAELRAHGVRKWSDIMTEKKVTATEQTPAPASAPAPTPMSTDASDAQPQIVTIDPATAPRKELIQALKGKTRENIHFMKADELRALAVKLLAPPPDAAKSPDTGKPEGPHHGSR